jgi:hypothetical protein
MTLDTASRDAGCVTSLRFRGAELLGDSGRIYTAVVDSVATAWHVGRSPMAHSVRRGSGFTDIGLIHRPDDAVPFEFEQHYVLRAGECGFHVYLN